MAEPVLPITGGCACGTVRYEVTRAARRRELLPLHPLPATQRHRRLRQRPAGAGHFRLVSGEEALRAWRPEGGGWEKLFCAECGSAVMSRDPEDHERMSIRMGTFDADPGIRPSVRQFTAYAASWEEIPDDGLPRHAESAHAD